MKIFAKTVDEVVGPVEAPSVVKDLGGGAKGINTFLSNALDIIYIFTTIIFLFMIVIAAFQWVTSGGDKEAVQKARSRITHAIIGIALLSFAKFLVALITDILRLNSPV